MWVIAISIFISSVILCAGIDNAVDKIINYKNSGGR